MRQHDPRQERRDGFTLIELLVVIAIIAVLVSLTTAAVMKALSKGPETVTRTEIGQLETAVENFKTKYKVDYVPSRIVLFSSRGSYTLTNQLHKDSVDYIERVWPRIAWATTTMNWGGTNGATLEGHQCLVFFLGGVQSGGGCLGFSTDPTNPTAAGGDRVSFYEFKPDRLKAVQGSYLSYLDPYKGLTTPYAYYSSYKTTNNYNPYGGNDNAGIGAQVYKVTTTAPIRYNKPDSFQIISAGADKNFGTDTTWTPASSGNLSANAKDNMSNFASGLLGNGQ
jgi:prepilin-type N-terminal cleavage/methylation domain-containing protein